MLNDRMTIIFNADDFGMRQITTDSICEMYNRGIVKSTTILSNLAEDDFCYAVEKAKTMPELGVGIHLNITEGKPLTGDNFPYCVDGVFFEPQRYYNEFRQGLILDLEAVEAEFIAQIEKVRSVGIKITHIDSHHHFHYKTPCLEVAKKLATKMRLPLRMPKELQVEGFCYADDFISMSKIESFEELTERIEGCIKKGDRIVEFGCHPTRVTEEMWKAGGWLEVPDRDWKMLNDERLPKLMHDLGIESGSYRALQHISKIWIS